MTLVLKTGKTDQSGHREQAVLSKTRPTHVYGLCIGLFGYLHLLCIGNAYFFVIKNYHDSHVHTVELADLRDLMTK